MQIDSTHISNFLSWLNAWYSPVVLISLFLLLFYIIKYKVFRDETKPRINDAHLNESSASTLSFVIANHRNYPITVLKIYYRVIYLGFIPSRKFRFKKGWEHPINTENPLFRKTIVEKEQSYIIPLVNGELTSNNKYKIYVKTSGGLCKAIARPVVHRMLQDLEKRLKSKKE